MSTQKLELTVLSCETTLSPVAFLVKSMNFPISCNSIARRDVSIHVNAFTESEHRKRAPKSLKNSAKDHSTAHLLIYNLLSVTSFSGVINENPNHTAASSCCIAVPTAHCNKNDNNDFGRTAISIRYLFLERMLSSVFPLSFSLFFKVLAGALFQRFLRTTKNNN